MERVKFLFAISAVLLLACCNSMSKEEILTRGYDDPDPNKPGLSDTQISLNSFNYLGESHNNVMALMTNDESVADLKIVYGDVDSFTAAIDMVSAQTEQHIKTLNLMESEKQIMIDFIPEVEYDVVPDVLYYEYFVDTLGFTPKYVRDTQNLFNNNLISELEYNLLNEITNLMMRAFNSEISDTQFIIELNALCDSWSEMVEISTRASSLDAIGYATGTALNIAQHSLDWWQSNNDKLEGTDSPELAHVVAADALGALRGAVISAGYQYFRHGTIDWKEVGYHAAVDAIFSSLGPLCTVVRNAWKGVNTIL